MNGKTWKELLSLFVQGSDKMKKDEFLNELEKRLRNIDWQERKEILNYYEELILDRMENTNLSEEDIVNELGRVEEIANKIINKQENIKTPWITYF